jgi:hypothetical protein
VSWLLLLACALDERSVLELEPVPSCVGDLQTLRLPDADVRGARVVGGDLPLRIRDGRLEALLLPGVEGRQEGVVRYRAGLLQLPQTAVVRVERAPLEARPEPEPAWMRVGFSSAELSAAAAAKSDRLGLGFEGEAEPVLELCAKGAGCKSLARGEETWLPEPLAASVEARLLDQDVIFQQKLTSRLPVTLSAGQPEWLLDGSVARMGVLRIEQDLSGPDQLPLEEAVTGKVRLDSGPGAAIWRLDLDHSQRLLVDFEGGPGLALSARRCDGRPADFEVDVDESAGRSVRAVDLSPGTWLFRVGVEPLSGWGGNYTLKAGVL